MLFIAAILSFAAYDGLQHGAGSCILHHPARALQWHQPHDATGRLQAMRYHLTALQVISFPDPRQCCSCPASDELCANLWLCCSSVMILALKSGHCCLHISPQPASILTSCCGCHSPRPVTQSHNLSLPVTTCAWPSSLFLPHLLPFWLARGKLACWHLHWCLRRALAFLHTADHCASSRGSGRQRI